MEPSDRHRWTNFVTSCTLDQSVDHLSEQGSNVSRCRQLPQLTSSIHTVPILECNKYWPCQDNDEEMGYIDNTQSVICDCGETQPMAHLPGRPHHRHREGNGMCPHVATTCLKDRREKKCNNGLGTICAQLTGVGNTRTRV